MDFKKNIKNILRESITETEVSMREAEGHDIGDDNASDEDYIEVTNKLLKSDIINHSAVMRRMQGIGSWGQADATERSLFEKKLKRKTNEEGGTYRFTRREIQKIKDILNDPFKA